MTLLVFLACTDSGKRDALANGVGDGGTSRDARVATEMDRSVPAVDAPMGTDAATGAWDGRYPEVPEGYPPYQCIPPCIWEALVACKVPELVERSCIWQSGYTEPPVSWQDTVCSTESRVTFEYSVEYGTVTQERISYTVDGVPCLTAEGFGWSGTGGGPLARRWYDGAGNGVAEDYYLAGVEDLHQQTVFCGSIDDPKSIPYPYDSYSGSVDSDPWVNPDCAPWLPYQGWPESHRFVFDGETLCSAGTCSTGVNASAP